MLETKKIIEIYTQTNKGITKEMKALKVTYSRLVSKGNYENAKIESLIEKSKLVSDFDLAILELEKLKKKCTERQITGLLFAVEKLEEIKEEFQ